MKINKNLFIYTIVVFSICMTILEVFLSLQSKEVSTSTQSVWGTVFLLLSILWVYYDADRKDFEKPFDFGFLVYVFWPIALPWYLVYTRGLRGILIFLGLISLWLGPRLAGLVVYFK